VIYDNTAKVISPIIALTSAAASAKKALPTHGHSCPKGVSALSTVGFVKENSNVLSAFAEANALSGKSPCAPRLLCTFESLYGS
jgi:hypothetical protein